MELASSWEYITNTARNRLANNKTGHQVTAYGEGIELLGVAGEIVARRFFGLDEILHEGFDDGIDFRFAGFRIDVKATALTPNIEHRFLQWPAWKRVVADIILFTAVDPTSQVGTVIGFATKAEILNSPINETRAIACHEISVAELHPAWKLEASFQQRKVANALLSKTLAS